MNFVNHTVTPIALVVFAVGALAGCVWSMAMFATMGCMLAAELFSGQFCLQTAAGA